MKTPFKRYLVGGAVRDQLLGLPVTERDWVVVGATPEQMIDAGYRPVGQDFPVFIDPGNGEEHALARTERKSGRGYGGFVFHTSPDVTLEEDLVRRDLTINAMALDSDGTLIDPFNGQHDLDARLLRHVSPAFVEDPLRVLRVARFAARYANLGFSVAAETRKLMRELAKSGELEALTPERSWKEISRALLEPRPDVFIEVLYDCGALGQLMPGVDSVLNATAEAHSSATSSSRKVLMALRETADMGLPLPARWACLVQELASKTVIDAPEPDLSAIEATNRRFKAPRDCQELALLTGRFQSIFDQPSLEPDRLLELFKAFDIYRRPERFDQFVQIGQARARVDAVNDAQQAHKNLGVLGGTAQRVRQVDVQSLLAQGLKGAELGEALHQARLDALAQYLGGLT